MKFQSEMLYAKVEGLYKTVDPENFVTTEVPELYFDLVGVSGDRHGGYDRISGGREKKYYKKGTKTRNNRQWSAVSIEEMRLIEDKMGVSPISAEWLGANLLVSGVEDFSNLPSLCHFQFGEDGPCFVLYHKNFPCKYPDEEIRSHFKKEVKESFPKAAKEMRGIVGWVDKPGIVRKGDTIKILIPMVEK